MEFYKDEGVFLELGEALPVFKPPYLDTLEPSTLNPFLITL